MRIEELDMTLRRWTSAKSVGHARTADGRSVTVGAVVSTDAEGEPRAYQVTILQGPVSVEGDWYPTIAESYEQAVLEALEGAPKLAQTVSDIARQVRQRRHAAEALHDAHLHLTDYEREAQEDAQKDALLAVDEEGWNL